MSKNIRKSSKSIETEKVPLMDKEYESDSDSSIEIKKEKPVKPKKVLSEKQLEALAKGRARAMETLKNKNKT